MAQDKILADRYRLISPLGRGGMGQVWEGRDERLGRPVAVKLLTAEALAGQARPEDGIRRFTREAAVTAGFTHPGVPGIYDAGASDGGFFLVMELIEGTTVGDLIAEQGALPVPWVAAIGAQVTAVLAVAHDREVIHRDIKPPNVMVTRDGTVKVLDFGVAGIADQRITGTGIAVGTPAYMAPEQLHNLPPTPLSDLYALGCLLYEMLTGVPVFAAVSPAALMRMHLEQAPAPLRRDDLDPRFEALVWQLLEKDPARRPAGAREVYQRLMPFVQQPGPIGDIDPAASGQEGMSLYSRVVVRLAGAGPGASHGGAPMPAPWGPAPWGPAPWGPPNWVPPQPPQPSPWGYPAPVPAGYVPGPGISRRSFGWTVRHSLWLLPTLVPLCAWLSFLYLGIRHQRLSWAATGGAYLAALIASFVLFGTDPGINSPGTTLDAQAVIALVLMFGTWPAGFLQGLWINARTRLPLLAAGGSRAGWKR